MTSRAEPERTPDVDGVRRNASKRPNRSALSFAGRAQTYLELDSACDRVARSLMRSGLRPGDRIAYLGKNADVFVELLFGAMRARCVLVPVNWRLTAAEAQRVVADSEAAVIFADIAFVSVASTILAQTAGLTALIAFDPADPKRGAYPQWRDGSASGTPLPASEGDDVFLQLYTSGTTGHPKGVLVSRDRYGAHLARQEGVDLPWMVYEPQDVILNAMPTFHLSGCCPTLDAFWAGAELVLLEEFHPGRVVDALIDQGVTRTFVVPAALRTLLEDPRLDVKPDLNLRYVGYGASPIAPALLQHAIQRLGCQFVHFYGMTEALTYISALSPLDHDPGLGRRWTSVGRPLPGLMLRISDDKDSPVESGVLGEIQIRAPFLTSGYWKKPEESARLFTADGWLRTGDAGELDDAGFLHIRDRLTDMIISGGENIYPGEIESVLLNHPDVSEAVVVGIADDRWGEKVIAAIVPTRAALQPEDLRLWLQGRLAPYKQPKAFVLLDALPRNGAGKVLKRELRDRLGRPALAAQGAVT